MEASPLPAGPQMLPPKPTPSPEKIPVQLAYLAFSLVAVLFLLVWLQRRASRRRSKVAQVRSLQQGWAGSSRTQHGHSAHGTHRGGEGGEGQGPSQGVLSPRTRMPPSSQATGSLWETTGGQETWDVWTVGVSAHGSPPDREALGSTQRGSSGRTAAPVAQSTKISSSKALDPRGYPPLPRPGPERRRRAMLL